jgi:hypothetical protein
MKADLAQGMGEPTHGNHGHLASQNSRVASLQMGMLWCTDNSPLQMRNHAAAQPRNSFLAHWAGPASISDSPGGQREIARKTVLKRHIMAYLRYLDLFRLEASWSNLKATKTLKNNETIRNPFWTFLNYCYPLSLQSLEYLLVHAFSTLWKIQSRNVSFAAFWTWCQLLTDNDHGIRSNKNQNQQKSIEIILIYYILTESVSSQRCPCRSHLELHSGCAAFWAARWLHCPRSPAGDTNGILWQSSWSLEYHGISYLGIIASLLKFLHSMIPSNPSTKNMNSGSTCSTWYSASKDAFLSRSGTFCDVGHGYLQPSKLKRNLGQYSRRLVGCIEWFSSVLGKATSCYYRLL